MKIPSAKNPQELKNATTDAASVVNVSSTNDGSISTDLYTKPTDKHQHLLYSSCHPLQTKTAIPFSLALRLRRICSTDATFNTRAAQLTTYLLKRGYNRNFVTKQIRRAADIPRNRFGGLCGVRSAECGVRSAECGKCGVWKMRSVENEECGK